MNWQRIKTGRWHDITTNSIVMFARRRAGPKNPTYAVAVRVPRERREDICFFRGKNTYRRYIAAVKAILLREIEDNERVHSHFLREGDAVFLHEISRLRLRSLAELPDLRRHKEALGWTKRQQTS